MNEITRETRPPEKERVLIITKRSGKKTFPPLCSRCANRESVDVFGDTCCCGLMSESMKCGTPVPHCVYFEKVQP